MPDAVLIVIGKGFTVRLFVEWTHLVSVQSDDIATFQLEGTLSCERLASLHKFKTFVPITIGTFSL